MWIDKGEVEVPPSLPKYYRQWEVSPELTGPHVFLSLRKETSGGCTNFYLSLTTSPYTAYGLYETIYSLEDLDDCITPSQLDELEDYIREKERGLKLLKNLRAAYDVFTAAIPELKEILKSEGME